VSRAAPWTRCCRFLVVVVLCDLAAILAHVLLVNLLSKVAVGITRTEVDPDTGKLILTIGITNVGRRTVYYSGPSKEQPSMVAYSVAHGSEWSPFEMCYPRAIMNKRWSLSRKGTLTSTVPAGQARSQATRLRVRFIYRVVEREGPYMVLPFEYLLTTRHADSAPVAVSWGRGRDRHSAGTQGGGPR